MRLMQGVCLHIVAALTPDTKRRLEAGTLSTTSFYARQLEFHRS